MRNFDPVDQKLAETDFFLGEISKASQNWFHTRVYFSAFVSAARSVTFALQASMKGAPGFAEWYSNRQDRLKSNPDARFFHECRTDSQHLGLNPVVGGTMVDGKNLYFFGQPEWGRYSYIPEADVLTSCSEHMHRMCEIIDACYQDFGLLIDPDQIYTPSGLAELKWTIEDVEEELGLPKGYTDIDWKGTDKDTHRLAMLRRNIPGSGVKPLLVKYLGRELTYPCEPFHVER